MTAVPDRIEHAGFLAGGGEMGRRIAELDGRGPLGPPASWSSTLRAAVGICVSSRHPMVIWWGPELLQLYNDAWVPLLGPAKHPALGRPGIEVWPEMWHIIGRQLTGVLQTGEGTWSDDQLLPAHRFGYLEEAYFTYSHSPIRTDDGHVAGVFTAVTETTSRVLGERRLRTLRELGDVAQAADVDQACARTLAALATDRADIPFAAVYIAPDGGNARLVATEGLDRAVLPETLPPSGPVGHSIWRAVTENRTVGTSGLATRLPGLVRPGHSPVGDADVDLAWAIPLTDAGRERPFGVLVLGSSPHRAVDSAYRSFLDLAADRVSTALTDVRAHELARLRSLEARWRTAMIDSLQDGFSVIDVDSAAIVEINPAMTELLGLRPEHLPCGPPYPIYPTAEEDAAELALLRKAYSAARGRTHGEVVVPLRHVTTRERVWVSVSYSALPGRDGQGACYVATMRDVTGPRRAAERESLLAAVGALLAEPVTLTHRMERFTHLVKGVLAELAVVSLRTPDGCLAPIAAADAHRPDAAWARLVDPPRSLPPDLARRYRAGRPVVGVDPRSLVVPLVVAGRLLGAIDLLHPSGGARTWDASDIALAEELGRRIAGAVDADRLALREAQLQSVTTRLAAAGTLVEAATALVTGVREALAARTVAVYAGGPDAPMRLVRRVGPGLPDGTVPLDRDSPQAHAVHAGGAVWLGDGAARRDRFPDADHAGEHAVAAIPLLSGEHVVGVLVADFDSARDFPADERDFALALTGQAAQAFERAALADQRWRLAQTLQRALLPPTLPALERVGLAARYLPAMRDLQAGGDWYDVVALDATRVAMVVGDVVGQGPAAAALMGQLRSVLATYLHDGLGPAAALEGLDRATHRIAGARGSTALCLILDTGSGDLRWSAAGHLPPLLTGPDGARYTCGGEGTLLGMPGRPAYVEGVATISPGTTIALYTDGLVERRGEVVDDGLDRLAEAAALLHGSAPDPLVRELLHRTVDGADTNDDVALVLARYLPASLDERFPADGAQARAVRQQLLRWSAEAGLTPDATGDLVLVVSEIVTNCVEHAYRDGPGEIVCSVGLVATGGVRIRVQDFGSWRPPPADPGYRGRGLTVVHTLAEHVELDATPRGTTVTALLAADAEPLAERAAADPAPQWWSRPAGRTRQG